MVKDGHIRLLPIHIANKIAAGEVVERPASVVKELLENAIDAGATRVDITVTAGGRKLIEVRDNGSGMGRDDALLSIERQATSKIRDVDDIERIDTLGFRGEALPSIASVSRFILKSRRASDEAGTQLVIIGGSLQDVCVAGAPPGTTVEVRDLFFNVPARRKFLRAYQTEQAHIRSVFTLHALAHPEIGLSLTADGHEVTRLPPGATREERLRDLFGAEFCSVLRPVSGRHNGVTVSGFAGIPSVTRRDRSEQYVFINHRPATAPIIAYALREAYPPLEGDRKPIVVLFVDLPPDEVDVNVHPTKREVRFRKNADVREALITAVSAALGVKRSPTQHAPVCRTELPPAVSLKSLAPEAAAVPVQTFPYPGQPIATPEPPPCAPLSPVSPAIALTSLPPSASPAPTGSGLPLFGGAEDGSPWRWVRVLGQIAERYLLLETDGGFVTLDPAAARERVLYERLMTEWRNEAIVSQQLLLPETVQLAPPEATRLKKYLSVLQEMGFGVVVFGVDHFLVESLPDVLSGISCRELLTNIIHDFEQAGARRGAEKWREELVARTACRVAAGTTATLTPEAAEKLVSDLAATQMPYTCPRGRPTMIFTSYRELNRKFGR